MQAQHSVGRGLAGGLDLAGHGPGIAGADGVGQADLRHAQVRQGPDHVRHLIHRDLALERTAPDARDHGRQGRGAVRRRRIVPAGDDFAQHGQLVLDRQALVLQAEAVGGRDRDIDLVHPRRQRPVIALAVQDQADAAAARRMRQGGHDGHLGHISGMDEGDGLDPARAGRFQPPHQIDADGGVQHGFLVLQPVAGADLDDLDEPAHGASPAPSPASSPVPGRGGGA